MGFIFFLYIEIGPVGHYLFSVYNMSTSSLCPYLIIQPTHTSFMDCTAISIKTFADKFRSSSSSQFTEWLIPSLTKTWKRKVLFNSRSMLACCFFFFFLNSPFCLKFNIAQSAVLIVSSDFPTTTLARQMSSLRQPQQHPTLPQTT